MCIRDRLTQATFGATMGEINALGTALQTNTALTSLDLSGAESKAISLALGSTLLASVESALGYLHTDEWSTRADSDTLKLSKQGLKDESGLLIAYLLERNSVLTSLDLHTNELAVTSSF